MVHSAFELFPLLEQLPVRVESLAISGHTLFIGSNDGVLLAYTVNYQKNDKNKRFTVSSSQSLTKKGFAKKAITQLCVIPELGLLVSLSDGTVRLHVLGSLKEVSSLQIQGNILKSVTFFAIKKEKGEFHMVATDKKRALHLFLYDCKETAFKPVKEFTLPDVPKSVTWSGKSVCVGFKREYCLINTDTGSSKQLFQTGANQNVTLGVSLCDEIILARESVGIPLTFEGKPTRSYGISWSEMPQCIGFLKPYLIAPVSNFIEVRVLTMSSKKDSLVQTVPLPGITKISQPYYVDLDDHQMDDGLGVGYKVREKIDPDDDIMPESRIFLASKNNVYVLCMKQIFLQVKELQNKRDFEQALNLCEMFEGSPFEVEKWRMHSVHMDYGFHLFAQGEFEGAMEHFTKTEDDPRIVLSLFPDLVIKSSNWGAPPAPYSPEEKKKVDKLLSESEQRNSALSTLIPFLSCRRVPVSKVDISQDEINIAEAVDTALLKAMLFTKDEFVTKFIEGPNRCNISDSEKILHHFKKFNELIQFYKSKGLHEKALHLLRYLFENTSIEEDSKSDTTGTSSFRSVKGIIKYLQELQGNLPLILEFGKWVLKVEPIIGLQIFTYKHTPFQINEILSYLDTVDPQRALSMKIAYLEHWVIVEKSTDSDLHNTLVLLYLKYVQMDSKGKEVFEIQEVSGHLKKFLATSRYYHPERMLSKFPFDSLFEERAILLSKINRHSQALNIYVSKLKRFDMAEKYCEDNFNLTNEESREIWLTLLNMHLKPSVPNEEPNVKEAIGILERHYEQIDLIKALKLLPFNVDIMSMRKFFEAVLRKQTETRRSGQVSCQLARAENLQVQEKHIVERKRQVKIKSGRSCPVCNKRIGLSAFACYPNGIVVHYVCCKNMNICPVTGKNFERENINFLLDKNFVTK